MNEEKVEKQLKVALYLRVSTDDQAEKYGPASQRAAIEGCIKSKGKLKDGRDAMVLAGKPYEYFDDDISGTMDIDERPEFARLKEDILNAPEGQRPFDVVAVYKIDRFARKLKILMDVINFFEEKKIEFISATESIDTSTPFGRAMLGIMGVIAELERETILQRTKAGREQAILAGVFMGANPPLGYKKDKEGHLEKFDEEADIVERIFSYFTVDRFNPQKIADILTEKEIPTPDVSAVKNEKRKGVSHKLNAPNFWRAERIREILANDIYTGVLFTNKSKDGKLLPKKDWKESPHQHEAIIYSHIFELAKLRLADLSAHKTVTKKKEQGNLYLLSGLLKCDHCRKLTTPPESNMMSWTGGKKFINDTQKYTYHYQCNRKNIKKFSIVCPVVPIPADPLEEYVINFVKQLLSDPQAVYEYQKGLASSKLASQNVKRMELDKKHYIELLNALPQRRQNLKDQQEMGAISTPVLKGKLDELNGKVKQYKEKMTEIDFRLSQVTLSKGYEASLKLYSEKYGKSLDTILKDRKQLQDLIQMLISEVVVYSRPKQVTDVIAGRKKENQMIPERIDIYLNLPQHLLNHLYSQRFVVKSDNL